MTNSNIPSRLRAVRAPSVFLIASAMACFPFASSLRTVHASSSKSIDLGATLFHEKGCEHCHGVDGHGGELGPDLSTIGKRWKNPQIEHQIHDGGGGMPAFADVLQPDEVTALVEYLHTKRKAPKRKKGAPADQPLKAPTPPQDPS